MRSCYRCFKAQKDQGRKDPLFIITNFMGRDNEERICISCLMETTRKQENRNMRAILLQVEEEFSSIKFKYERLKAVLDDIDQHEGRNNLRNDMSLKASGDRLYSLWMDIED